MAALASRQFEVAVLLVTRCNRKAFGRAGRGVGFGGWARVKQIRVAPRPHVVSGAGASQFRVTDILGNGFMAGVR